MSILNILDLNIQLSKANNEFLNNQSHKANSYWQTYIDCKVSRHLYKANIEKLRDSNRLDNYRKDLLNILGHSYHK
jgi:hypothetical protein